MGTRALKIAQSKHNNVTVVYFKQVFYIYINKQTVVLSSHQDEKPLEGTWKTKERMASKNPSFLPICISRAVSSAHCMTLFNSTLIVSLLSLFWWLFSLQDWLTYYSSVCWVENCKFYFMTTLASHRAKSIFFIIPYLWCLVSSIPSQPPSWHICPSSPPPAASVPPVSPPLFSLHQGPLPFPPHQAFCQHQEGLLRDTKQKRNTLDTTTAPAGFQDWAVKLVCETRDDKQINWLNEIEADVFHKHRYNLQHFTLELLLSASIQCYLTSNAKTFPFLVFCWPFSLTIWFS